MLISIHILNLLIALIDMKEEWSLPDMANVKSLSSIPPAAHMYISDYVLAQCTQAGTHKQKKKDLITEMCTLT